MFARVQTWRVHTGDRRLVGDERTDDWPSARAFSDYAITVDAEALPEGVEIIEK